VAVCAHTEGKEALAARLFGLADWVASENRLAIWPPPEEHDYAVQVGDTQEALGSLEFAHATVQGESLTVADALELIHAEFPDQ
jgi:hypothetical protein